MNFVETLQEPAAYLELLLYEFGPNEQRRMIIPAPSHVHKRTCTSPCEYNLGKFCLGFVPLELKTRTITKEKLLHAGLLTLSLETNSRQHKNLLSQS